MSSEGTITRPVFPVPQPTIQTERLVLRPLTAADVPSFYSLRTDPAVVCWTSTPDGDPDEAATLRWLQRFLPPKHTETFVLAVCERSNPELAIGSIGCHIAEPPECGYLIRQEWWGKGYATEALRAWLDVYWKLPRREIKMEEFGGLRHSEGYVDPHRAREYLIGSTDKSNRASQGVLAKAGFERRREFRDPEVKSGEVYEWVLVRPSSEKYAAEKN
ncbi:MAG: hypothetical protein Q9227_001633 [Pyrenula ochraceoflavens]